MSFTNAYYVDWIFCLEIKNKQISQVDRNKCIPNQSGKAIENQIQITPIVDSNKAANASVQLPNNVIGITTSQQQQVTPSINSLNNNPGITMNLQPNHQILNIPNNVQIISSSSSNNLSTHGNIITNSISSMSGNNGGGVIINTSQSYHPQIGLQRPIQSSGVQTITNQGALINTSAQLSQAGNGHRQIQMTMQPTPNIQMQMLPTTPIHTEAPQMTTLPQLTGHLSLSFSEDGRLLLKHNANAPQDSQSQMILQAILSGALCNVTLINESAATTQPQPNIQQSHIMDNNKPSIILKSNDAVPKPIISSSNTMVTNANVNDRQQSMVSSNSFRTFTSKTLLVDLEFSMRKSEKKTNLDFPSFDLFSDYITVRTKSAQFSECDTAHSKSAANTISASTVITATPIITESDRKYCTKYDGQCTHE